MMTIEKINLSDQEIKRAIERWDLTACNGQPGSCGHHNNCIHFRRDLAPTSQTTVL